MKNPRVLLASDMDGTVIPMEVNAQREQEIAAFRTAVEADTGLGLAYVTGRDLRHALEGIDRHRLPTPDILVCDVGTSVYTSTPSGFEMDLEYVRLMETARGGLDIREVRPEMAHLPDLLLQPDHRHTESKVSYHLAKGSDQRQVLASVREILEGLGGTVQAVCSVGAPRGTRLLDLLPAGVAKDFALAVPPRPHRSGRRFPGVRRRLRKRPRRHAHGVQGHRGGERRSGAQRGIGGSR